MWLQLQNLLFLMRYTAFLSGKNQHPGMWHSALTSTRNVLKHNSKFGSHSQDVLVGSGIIVAEGIVDFTASVAVVLTTSLDS